jgi:hypothetical protein
MIARRTAGVAFPLGVTVLVVVIAVLGAYLAFVVVPRLAGGAPSATATPAPTSSPATVPMAVGSAQIGMSPNADCGACHLDSTGVLDTRQIPVMAHPLQGWTDCTACHADDRLVLTAPGHSGLHKDDCLICHRAPAAGSAAPERPHHVVAGTACITCHGSGAPLPTDMQGRTNCWLCHPGSEFDALFGAPQPTPGTEPLGTYPLVSPGS